MEKPMTQKELWLRYGIPYRLVCLDCREKIMRERGFDGEAYTPSDECMDYDY